MLAETCRQLLRINCLAFNWMSSKPALMQQSVLIHGSTSQPTHLSSVVSLVSLRLFAAAAASGSAPLSRCPRSPGPTAPSPFRPAATRHPPRDGRWLRPAGSRRSWQPSPPACEGWEEPPRPGAPRWGAKPATHKHAAYGILGMMANCSCQALLSPAKYINQWNTSI